MNDESVNSNSAHEDASNIPQDENKVVFKIPNVLIGPKLLPPANSLEAKLDGEPESNETEIPSNNKVEVVNPPANLPSSIVEREAVPPSENKVQERAAPLPYKEPTWSGTVDLAYTLEVLKGGVIIDNIKLNDKPFYVVGRLPACNIVLEHPSISRYHAAIQYRLQGTEEYPIGFYLYDMNSTHGTCLNKQPIQPRCYYRLRVGYMIKFGGSSRTFIIQGPPDDQDEESEMSVTELKELRKKQEQELDELESKKQENPSQDPDSSESGIDWGLGEDADEEDDLAENPFALDAAAPNEELYFDDPKKTLRGWFEREGYDLEYKVEEKGFSQFLCRIQLPLDSLSGEFTYAEATVKGKKKAAVIACALEACRILDRQGLLRQATHESRKRKQKNWEQDDYYDSDEDTFLDRTGTIEKKRQQRLSRAGKDEQTVETYDSLVSKMKVISEEIANIEKDINANKKPMDLEEMEDKEIDELDAYMSSIQTMPTISQTDISALKLRLSQLKQEETRLQQLANIAKPVSLPEIKYDGKQPLTNSCQSETTTKKPFPSIGAMKGFHKNKFKEIHLGPSKTKQSLDNEQSMVKQNEKQTEETEKCLRLADPLQKDEKLTTVETNGIKTQTADVHKQEEKTKEATGASSTKINFVLPRTRERKRRKPTSFEYDTSDPDYAMWLPPADQSGDGKTKLNEKYGY